MSDRGAVASVAIALGSNLGDRALYIRSAVDQLSRIICVARVSSVIETEPVDCPPGSPSFLNAVVVGCTALSPEELLGRLQRIEEKLGRRQPSPRNAPRTIDIDLILHSANVRRTRRLTLPHPRYLEREFVMKPLREMELAWRDPGTGVVLGGPPAPRA